MKKASESVAKQTNNNYYGVGGFTSIKAYFANYVNFTGRSSRREYWWLMLFSAIVGLIIGGVTIAVSIGAVIKLANSGDTAKLSSPIALLMSMLWLLLLLIVISLVTLLPSLSLVIRRFRDAGVHWAVYVALYAGQWLVYILLWHQATARLLLLAAIGITMLVITVLPTKDPPRDEAAGRE
ncbi:DUF805 domain-containing protein [Lacticaseibacillus sp. GG6-2]